MKYRALQTALHNDSLVQQGQVVESGEPLHELLVPTLPDHHLLPVWELVIGDAEPEPVRGPAAMGSHHRPSRGTVQPI